MNKIKNYIIGIAIPLAVGILAAVLTMNSMQLFENLNKPPISPPGFLFPIAWTVLYILMGISSVIIYRSHNPKRKTALAVYGIQLFFNFFWSILFFGFGLYLFSFIWLVILWLLILIMIVLFGGIKPIAAYLNFPYLLWVSFAGYLNFAIYLLNN